MVYMYQAPGYHIINTADCCTCIPVTVYDTIRLMLTCVQQQAAAAWLDSPTELSAATAETALEIRAPHPPDVLGEGAQTLCRVA